MIEFVWGSVGAAVVSDGVMEVSGSLAMNEQVSSSIMISNSDCLVTVLRRMSDNCWHLAFFVICLGIMESKLQTGVDFVGLAGEVFAQSFEGVDPFLQLQALCNDVPLWVLLFD